MCCARAYRNVKYIASHGNADDRRTYDEMKLISKCHSKGCRYRYDDRHLAVRTYVEVSDQFFGWLLGFGKRVKLTYPDDAVEEFRAYLDKVRAMYE